MLGRSFLFSTTEPKVAPNKQKARAQPKARVQREIFACQGK